MKSSFKLMIRLGLTTAWLASSAGAALAFGSPWVSVGSAGTVDEADIEEVSLSSGLATIKATAPAATTVVLRFNVVPAPDLEDGGANVAMDLRFLDNGANARVRAWLRRYSFATGATSTMLTFDSNTLPDAAGWRVSGVGDGCAGEHFNFDQNAYYIEVELSRTAEAGTAGIAIIQLRDIDIC